MSASPTAETLKAAGNALFVRKDYASAIVKYTKAIALDDQNAVLYANRSACQRSLKRYTEALADAVTATKLDPTYSKAWGRAGDAYNLIGEHLRSVEAYKTAIETLPKENLSPAELKQKAQYEEGMKLSQEIINKPPIPIKEANPGAFQFNTLVDKPPWIVAGEMIDELRRTQYFDSAAWSLDGAYREFSDGVQIMKHSRLIRNSQGMAVVGDTGALQALVNALIGNEHVFHIDGSSWLDSFNRQMELEQMHHKPWPIHVSPSQIISQAPGRVKREGWRPVRMAITMNVRFWIMRGFLDGTLSREYGHKYEFLKNAVTVLRWGTQTWKDVPREDRGAIFEPTFINGVRRMYINSIMEHANEKHADRDMLLALLATEARELIKDIDASDTAGLNFASIWAFQKNCRGTAHATLGFHHVQQLADSDADEAKEHLRAAADCYLQAADGYATDDQSHTWFLHCALEYLIKCGAPASEQLSVVRRLKDTLPKMRKLWWAGPGLVHKAKERTYAADLALEPLLERTS